MKAVAGRKLLLFIHDLKKLLDRVLPDVDATAGEQFLLNQYLTGLLTAVGKQFQATAETKDLELTVEQAWLHMALDDQEPAAAVRTENSQLKG